MGAARTRRHAIVVADQMAKRGFTPDVIVNIGVGSCPERTVWAARYQDAFWIGIDPRRLTIRPPCRNNRYIQAAAVEDPSIPVAFCRRCMSLVCTDSAHVKREPVVGVCIDDVLRHVTGTLFLWIDIEGSEADALLGAPESLQRAGFVNVEMTTNTDAVDAILRQAGFREVYRSSTTADRLYAKG